MALNITDFYDKSFFSQLGSEYICTGYMYDMIDTNVPSVASQLSSWDLSGVTSGRDYSKSGWLAYAELEDDYDMSSGGGY
jgi:hypothetical protein|tara:strand:+ start:7314 stop:7553 length:240 start_codon:yes stop_codon:yes gene_type:complete